MSSHTPYVYAAKNKFEGLQFSGLLEWFCYMFLGIYTSVGAWLVHYGISQITVIIATAAMASLMSVRAGMP